MKNGVIFFRVGFLPEFTLSSEKDKWFIVKLLSEASISAGLTLLKQKQKHFFYIFLFTMFILHSRESDVSLCVGR